MEHAAFGDDELGGPIEKGDVMNCPHCGEQHEVKNGLRMPDMVEDDTIQFYTCGKESFVVGIEGKRVS